MKDVLSLQVLRFSQPVFARMLQLFGVGVAPAMIFMTWLIGIFLDLLLQRCPRRLMI